MSKGPPTFSADGSQVKYALIFSLLVCNFAMRTRKTSISSATPLPLTRCCWSTRCATVRRLDTSPNWHKSWPMWLQWLERRSLHPSLTAHSTSPRLSLGTRTTASCEYQSIPPDMMVYWWGLLPKVSYQPVAPLGYCETALLIFCHVFHIHIHEFLPAAHSGGRSRSHFVSFLTLFGRAGISLVHCRDFRAYGISSASAICSRRPRRCTA